MKEIAYSRFMSASPSAPEVVVGAVLEKTPVAGPALTPEQQLSNQIRAGITKEVPPRTILDKLRASKPEKTSGDPLQKRIDETFDTDADKDLARAFDVFSRKIIDDGYDTLDPVEKLGASGKVLEMLSSFEDTADYLNGLTPAEKNAIAEEILRDPDFIAKANDRYGEIAADKALDSANSADDDRLKIQEDVRYQAEKEARKAREEWDKLDRQVSASYKLVDRYSITESGIDPSTGLEYGDKRIALQAAVEAVTAISPDVKYLEQQEQEVREYTAEIDDLVAALNIIGVTNVAVKNRRLDFLRTERRAANGRINAYNNAVKDRDALIAERDGLPDKIKELEGQKETAGGVLDQKAKAYHAADAEFQKLQLEIAEDQRTDAESRTKAQKKLLVDLENVLYDATQRWFEKGIEEAEAEYEKIQDKKAQETHDAFEKAVLNKMKTRYDKREGTIKKRSKAAEGDFDMLTDETLGPKAVLTEYLMRAGYEIEDPPGSGNMVLSPEGAEKMKDEAFVNKMTGELTVKIVREKLKNGKLNKAERLAIEDNKELSEALVTAMEEDEHYKHKIAELKAKGIIPKNLKDHMNTVTGKKSLMLLLLTIFGGVPGFLVGRVILKDAWGAAPSH